MFGKNFQFTIGKGNITSWLGGMLTLLYCLCVLACFGYFGKDLYFKEAPLLIETKRHLDDFPGYNLSNFESPLTARFNLGFYNLTGYYLPGYFYVYAQHYRYQYEDDVIDLETVTKLNLTGPIDGSSSRTCQ